jgi:WD40 repeat protein
LQGSRPIIHGGLQLGSAPPKIHAMSDFYVTGGTLRHDAPSYVERGADRELYGALNRGEFCYVLTARQTGKSSLMVRTAARLRQQGVQVALLDLSAMGANLTAEQWYEDLLDTVGLRLGLQDELEAYWREHASLGPLRRWMRALREVVLARCPDRIVLFVDEIDAVRNLPFSTDELFAAIRECYNRRTEDPAFDRLTFCLLGVASPSDLIRDTRTTPFNIGRRIELTDFTEAEAAPLAVGLTSPPAPPRSGEGSLPVPGSPPVNQRPAPPPHFGEGVGGRGQPLLHRILHWTGGHPYLTQRLCQAVAEDATVTDAADVDRICAELFLSRKARQRDDNLLFVRERLLRSEADLVGLLDLYAKVCRGKRVPDDETNPLVGILRLSGVARVEDGALAVRNRIYERVFDAEWMRANMPDAELRRQRAAYRRGLLRATGVAGAVLAVIAGLAVAAVRQAGIARNEARWSRRLLYASQMNLAQQSCDAANAARAVELLDAQRPGPGQEDLRGFDWRYLWRMAHQDDAEFTLAAHREPLSSVLFSPDGKTLATSSSDHTVKLWDVATKHAKATLHRDGRVVWRMAFSPDGATLAAASGEDYDSLVTLWDVAMHQQIATLPPKDGVGPIAFSPNGRVLATAGMTTVRLWDLSTKRETAALGGHRDGIRALAFSPDGRSLASGGNDGTVRLWDVKEKCEVARLLGMEDWVASLAFDPDGQLLAAGGYRNGKVKLWDVPARRMAATLSGHRSGDVYVAFSPDGRWLATGGSDYTVRLWSTRSWEQAAILRGHRNAVTSVAFSPDGLRLASASWDGTVKFWPTIPTTADLLRGHASRVNAVAFSADGRRLASGSDDHTIRVWDVPTRRVVRARTGLSGRVAGLALSPDGSTLAASIGATTVQVWDVTRNREIGSFTRKTPWPSPLAFSPDGQLLARAGDGKTLNLWDVSAMKEAGTLRGHSGDLRAIAFSPDGRWLAAAGIGPALKLWDVGSRREAASLTGHTSSIFALAFSPDSRWLASAGFDYTVRVWDVTTHRLVTTLRGYTDEIDWLGFTPDGKTLISSSGGSGIKLWSAASWLETVTLDDPMLAIQAVALSPDGNTLATGRVDGLIRMWRASSSVAEMATHGRSR